jgi:hypothetical protein
MFLICELFGHWPTPLATRRRDGLKANRCWLCEHGIVHRDGCWEIDLISSRSRSDKPRSSITVSDV